MIFSKIQFPFKSKNLITWSQNISPGAWKILVQLVYVMKYLLSRLVSADVLYLQSTQKNLAFYFPESLPASCLSAQTPKNSEDSSFVKPPDFSVLGDSCTFVRAFIVFKAYSSELGFFKCSLSCLKITQNFRHFASKSLVLQYLSIKKVVCCDFVRIFFLYKR